MQDQIYLYTIFIELLYDITVMYKLVILFEFHSNTFCLFKILV